MIDSSDLLSSVRAGSEMATFHRWLVLEVSDARPGEVELRLRWREEFGQYMGFLHAGIVAALIDSACGFAAGTVAGRVLTSQFLPICACGRRSPKRSSHAVAL